MCDGGAVRRGARALRVGARVAGNSIGDEGAGKLAAALQINSTITTLNLISACPSLDWTRPGSSTAPLPPLAPTARGMRHSQGMAKCTPVPPLPPRGALPSRDCE